MVRVDGAQIVQQRAHAPYFFRVRHRCSASDYELTAARYLIEESIDLVVIYICCQYNGNVIAERKAFQGT